MPGWPRAWVEPRTGPSWAPSPARDPLCKGTPCAHGIEAGGFEKVLDEVQLRGGAELAATVWMGGACGFQDVNKVVIDGRGGEGQPGVGWEEGPCEGPRKAGLEPLPSASPILVLCPRDSPCQGPISLPLGTIGGTFMKSSHSIGTVSGSNQEFKSPIWVSDQLSHFWQVCGQFHPSALKLPLWGCELG